MLSTIETKMCYFDFEVCEKNVDINLLRTLFFFLFFGVEFSFVFYFVFATAYNFMLTILAFY